MTATLHYTLTVIMGDSVPFKPRRGGTSCGESDGDVVEQERCVGCTVLECCRCHLVLCVRGTAHCARCHAEAELLVRPAGGNAARCPRAIMTSVDVAAPPEPQAEAQPHATPSSDVNLASSVAASPFVLRVRPLSRTVTAAHLQEIFSHFGSVSRVLLPLDGRVQLPLGYALIELGSEEEAERAQGCMDGGWIDGQRMTVTRREHKDAHRQAAETARAGGGATVANGSAAVEPRRRPSDDRREEEGGGRSWAEMERGGRERRGSNSQRAGDRRGSRSASPDRRRRGSVEDRDERRRRSREEERSGFSRDRRRRRRSRSRSSGSSSDERRSGRSHSRERRAAAGRGSRR